MELDNKMKVSVVTSLAAFELMSDKNPQEQTMSFFLLYEVSPNHATALTEKLQQFTALINIHIFEISK